MNRRTVSLLVLVVLATLTSFGSASQRNATQSATSKREAFAKSPARKKTPSPPPNNIGFLSATQIPVGGYDNTTYFPPVAGDFNGDGNEDAAIVVQTTSGTNPYQISVILGNGDGTFQPAVLTPTTASAADPIWVGDVNGDGKSDLVMGHGPKIGTPASFEVWLADTNGDGGFVSQGLVSLGKSFSGHITWGTLYKDTNTGFLDVAIIDGVNSVVWTGLGNGDGTFKTPTSVGFSPAISPDSNVAFADFDGDGILDFAATVTSNNQDAVFYGTGTGFTAPVLLTTSDGLYDTCWTTAGDLNKDGYPDIVTANGPCGTGNALADNVTVYINNGTSRTFSDPGTYYPSIGGPQAVTIADVDGDGNNDVITTDALSGDLAVLFGYGTGALSKPSMGYAAGGSPLSPVLVAPFDKNDKADVLVSDRHFSLVYLKGYGDQSVALRSALNYYANPAGGGYLPNGVDIATGDFNGDGTPDFVIGNDKITPNTGFSGVTVFIANPATGSLQPGVNYSGNAKTSSLQYVAVADFNADGKLDIAAADSVNGAVWIFTGNGDGTFNSPTVSYPTGTAASALGLVVGDFNGDGKPDLAVVNNYSTGTADVAVLIGNGDGTFQAPVNYPIAAPATNITTADLNGDNKLDLIVPLSGTSSAPGTTVAVLLGNGDGTFAAPQSVALGFNNPFYAAVGDLNGDGIPDLAVTIQDQITPTNQGIAVALGNGDGTFKAPTLLPATLQNTGFAAPLPAYIKTVDLDLDGHLDLIYTNSGYGTVVVAYGQGNGSFYDPVEYGASHQAFGLALADVNGDGSVDVGTTGNFSFGFSGVTVLLNKGGTTTLQSSNPHVPLGTSVTFTATVDGANLLGVPPVPTGTVTFFDGSTALGSPVALSSSGTYTAAAALSTSSLTAGTHSITAQYSGDANYVSSTSAVLIEVVGQSGSVTSTPTSSANPSTFGLSVTFSTTVSSTVSGDPNVPTGKVTFNDGTTALGSGTLANGKATYTTSSLAIGTHKITAVYGGDANFTGSTSAALTQVVNNAAAQPNYTIAANPTSQTVNPGTAASYTLTLTPSNGYDGTVTIACPTALPAGVTCNTPSIAPGKTTATLTISTTGPTSALIGTPDVNRRHADSNLWASLTGVGMLGMVLAGDWKKRNRRRMGIMLLVLALVMIVGLVGCGGSSNSGGGGGGGGGGTPAGTYQINATATGTAGTNGGNTSAHPVTVTLIVN
jgi:Bacterial Ig-like domain (group 3)/FG-GAP-like repeat